jgi:hypothetical protein
MKYLAIILALMTLGFGLTAAWYWYKSSKVDTHPAWQMIPWQMEPVERNDATDGWLVGIMVTAKEASRLNAIAAKWTAAAIIAGCLTSIAGSWPL